MFAGEAGLFRKGGSAALAEVLLGPGRKAARRGRCRLAQRHDLDTLLAEESLGGRAGGGMGILEALGVELALQLPGDAPAVAGTAARPVRARISRPGLDDEVVVFETVHPDVALPFARALEAAHALERSEEHTSELQSLMRISYAVFCLKKKTKK